MELSLSVTSEVFQSTSYQRIVRSMLGSSGSDVAIEMHGGDDMGTSDDSARIRWRDLLHSDNGVQQISRRFFHSLFPHSGQEAFKSA